MYIDLDRRKKRQASLPDKFDLYHDVQQRYYASQIRFNACCGGRRSGKSVIGRKRIVRAALRAHLEVDDPAPRFIIGAPTRDQVKRLHWHKLKPLIPANVRTAVYESELKVVLANNASIQCIGLDKHERAEGEAIHGALLDEIADMKEEAWTLSVRPSLGTKGAPGWCDMIGKPRGRNHWWRWWTEAAEKTGWAQFHWNAEDILDPEEIERLKEDLDPVSYDQEVRANFVNFAGRAYYSYISGLHDRFPLFYQPGIPLDIDLDFNVDPGSAGISQEQHWDDKAVFEPIWHGGEYITPWIQGRFTAVFDEIAILKNSNTLRVCREIINKYGTKHKGVVNVYADASGGARRTSALSGSDLDIVKREFAQVEGWKVRFQVPRRNPAERDRINAVNARFMSSNGRIRALVDREHAPNHCIDLEAVTVKQGTGEIDKRDLTLSHWTDGLGYKIHKIAPVKALSSQVYQV